MNGTVRIQIKTAIRKVSWASPQAGEKSAHKVFVDLKARSIKSEFATGHTEVLGIRLGSVRDEFKVEAQRFEKSGEALFEVLGSTASPVGVLPNIDYAFSFEVGEKQVNFWGSHDGYPSYSIYVNDVLCYDYVQGHIGQLLGAKDINVPKTTHLLK